MGNCLSPCSHHRCLGEDEEVRLDAEGGSELQDVLQHEETLPKPSLDFQGVKIANTNVVERGSPNSCKSHNSFNVNCNAIKSPQFEEVYKAVQKELEDLQTQLTKSQSVLSSLRYRQFLIKDGARVVQLADKSSQTDLFDKLNRRGSKTDSEGLQKGDSQSTSTTIQIHKSETRTGPNLTLESDGAGTDGSGLEPPSSESTRLQTAKSCPAIVSTATSAVQTDLCDLTMSPKYYRQDEYFIPPISSPEFHDYQIDINGDFGQLLDSPIDLDIHRSCRKLSVLPEEPACNWRQMSDPGPAPSRSPKSTARPLQLPSRGDSAISSAGSSTSPPPQGTTPPASPAASPCPSTLTTPSPSTAPSPTGPEQPPSPPASPPLISSSSASLSFATPDDLPTDATLSPPSICRLPSRRKLVRSLATDNPSDSESPQKHNWELKDLMEACDIRIEEPGMVSRGQQTDGPPLQDDDLRQDPGNDQTDSMHQNYMSLINEALKDNTQSVEEIESMAVALMIAYKADKHTLDRRLEIQTRLRDQSETNVANEITNLNDILSQLMPMCEEGEKGALLRKLEEQIEMLHRSARYVSSVAEMYGAVQQEKRLFNAMEVLSRHVDNLKQNLVNEKLLHEQTRKLLSENKPHNSSMALDSKRRASIAALDQNHTMSDSRHFSRKGSLIKRFASCKSNSFSEISLDLRKGDSDSSLNVHGLDDNTDEHGDYHQDTTISDCSDVCRCTSNSSQNSNRESEIELYQRKKSLLQEETSSTQRKNYPMKYKFQKRGSFLAPRWFVRLAEAWGWNQMGDLANKIRYSAACALVVVAFAILSYNFLASDEHAI